MEILLIILIVAVAVAAVILPLLRRDGEEPLETPEPVATSQPDDAALEEEILTYREALRSGTLCRRCGTPNAPASRYCAECGRRLRSKAA
jgi:hypothetical protein